MTDELSGEVLERFVNGDPDAFESLFRMFGADVEQWVMRILRDRSTAEDAVVEAFWRAYRGRARFDPSRSFGAWMRRIATNVALDHLRALRRRGRWVELKDEMAAPAETDASLRESVRHAFEGLPDKLQIVATLALIEERPYGEIAEALQVPVGTVKSRVFRAIRALRKGLARAGIHP